MEEELEYTSEYINKELQTIDDKMDDSIGLYIKEIWDYELLEEEEQNKLFKKYQETKDINIKNKLIQHNLRLSIFVAKRYALYCQSLTLLDLIQECSITLMNIIEKYDVGKGFKFSSYAVKAMQRSIQRQMDNQDSIIRKPVHVEEKDFLYRNFIEKYYEQNKRYPTNEEIKEELEMTEDQLNIHKNLDILNVESLNRVVEIGDEDESEIENFVAYTEEGYEGYENNTDMKIKLIAAKQILNKSEYYIFYNRVISEDKKTLDEISKEYNFSIERARQVESIAIKKLREQLEEYEKKVLEEYTLVDINKMNVQPLSAKEVAGYILLKENTDDITYYFFYNKKQNNYSLIDFKKKFKAFKQNEVEELYDFCDELDRILDESTKNNELEKLQQKYTLTEIFKMDIEPNNVINKMIKESNQRKTLNSVKQNA